MTEIHRAQHDVFAKLLGFGFHHKHGFAGAGHDQVEGRISHLLEQRVQNIFSVDRADAGTADGAHEWDT